MSKDMAGKVAMVTGGGSGIGKATCQAFAAAGAKVMVADIAAEAGEATAAELRGNEHDAAFVKVDVSNEADVAALVATTLKTFGRLDFAHNNAGINQLKPQTVVDIEESLWEKIIATNLKGVFLA